MAWAYRLSVMVGLECPSRVCTVFMSTPFDSSMVACVWRSKSKRLDLLRHSKAVRLVEADVNLMCIRGFLGHASVTTTEVYAKISGKTRRREIEKASANIVKAGKCTEQEKSDIVEWLKSIM